MTDFHEMAKAAKAKSQAIDDAAAEKKRNEKAAEEQRLITAEMALRENILPILQAAATAFAVEGVDLKIKETNNWRLVSGSVGETREIRSIEFQFSSDEEEKLSKKGRIISDQFSFDHDGNSLTWKSSRTDKYGQKFIGGTLESFVSPIISKALDSFYEKLRSAR